jgi:hypothetical protein
MSAVKRFESVLGKRVEARYRVGYIYYSATGLLAADNGASIFIKEVFVQDGRRKILRTENPYECLLHLIEFSPRIYFQA